MHHAGQAGLLDEALGAGNPVGQIWARHSRTQQSVLLARFERCSATDHKLKLLITDQLAISHAALRCIDHLHYTAHNLQLCHRHAKPLRSQRQQCSTCFSSSGGHLRAAALHRCTGIRAALRR